MESTGGTESRRIRCLPDALICLEAMLSHKETSISQRDTLLSNR
jgi:hypothetical protein